MPALMFWLSPSLWTVVYDVCIYVATVLSIVGRKKKDALHEQNKSNKQKSDSFSRFG